MQYGHDIHVISRGYVTS